MKSSLVSAFALALVVLASLMDTAAAYVSLPNQVISCNTVKGDKCRFPFHYKGNTYYGCTKEGHEGGKFWCYIGDRGTLWGDCMDICTEVAWPTPTCPTGWSGSIRHPGYKSTCAKLFRVGAEVKWSEARDRCRSHGAEIGVYSLEHPNAPNFYRCEKDAEKSG